MKPNLFLLLVGCAMGFLHPAYATDWGDSDEVRNRLDRLRAQPAKATIGPIYVVDEPHARTDDARRRSQSAWRSVSYENVAPIESPKKQAHSSSGKMAVAEADKLGYQLNNTKVRDKILELYRRPDIVVEQYVIGQ